MDDFFKKTRCDRCGSPLEGVRIMSMFNEDCLCMRCKDAERQHKDYRKACDADIAQIRSGNYNYAGIGYPG